MNFKYSKAPKSTETRDVKELEAQTSNIYESIVIISKRANQIAMEMKEELSTKLQEFATSQDNLEEVFENREQIEISKHYEKLPKPHAMAVQELIDEELFFRYPQSDSAPAQA